MNIIIEQSETIQWLWIHFIWKKNKSFRMDFHFTIYQIGLKRQNGKSKNLYTQTSNQNLMNILQAYLL